MAPPPSSALRCISNSAISDQNSTSPENDTSKTTNERIQTCSARTAAPRTPTTPASVPDADNRCPSPPPPSRLRLLHPPSRQPVRVAGASLKSTHRSPGKRFNVPVAVPQSRFRSLRPRLLRPPHRPRRLHRPLLLVQHSLLPPLPHRPPLPQRHLLPLTRPRAAAAAASTAASLFPSAQPRARTAVMN